MGEACEDFGKWAEDIYWTHFQFTHFAKIIPVDFDRQLVVPRKFLNNLRKKLPSVVVLKGPSGVNWTVELATNDDSCYFKSGWTKFSEDHSLKANDLLIFKYNGDSLFNVLIFDGMSFCEKESSYFIGKCKHAELETEKTSKETQLARVIPANSNNDVECSSENLMDDDGVEEHSTEDESEAVRAKRNRHAGWSPTAYGFFSSSSVVRPTSPPKTIMTYRERYNSNRRPVTESEIARALSLAEAASTENTCRIVMRPSHVYREFYLSIPNAWMVKHLSCQSQDVILKVRSLTWLTRFLFNRDRRNGGLSHGWKCFALSNNLEEFDVCLFDLSHKTSHSIILDVRIFRVVSKVIPRTQVSAPSNN